MERTIIKPTKKGGVRRTGKIRQPDGTIRKDPMSGIKNIKPSKYYASGGKVFTGRN
jgi:hypothetical protein